MTKLEETLIKALGLPEHLKWFELRCEAQKAPTVRCEYYPSFSLNDKGELQTALAEFELRPKE